MTQTSRYSMRTVRPAFSVCMQLVQKAGEFWDVPTWRLLKRERTRKIAYARFAVCWALRETGLTYWAIAHHLNFKDHRSVIYGCKRAKHMRETDQDFLAKTDDLLAYARALRLVQTVAASKLAA